MQNPKKEKEIREITVYRLLTDAEKAELYEFINQAKNISDKTDLELVNLCDSIKAFICDKIKNGKLQEKEKLSNYSGIYRVIGKGSTAYCYQADLDSNTKILPALIKEFHPTLDAKEDISLCSGNECLEIPKCGFYWIADNAKKNSNTIKSFLSGFARFIEQEVGIIDVIRSHYQLDANNYFHPNLCISSGGIVHLDADICGTILTDKIEQLEEQNNSLNLLIDKFEMILRVAEGVAIYHKDGHTIFNGDLKPSNLFQIEDGGIPRVIRNIDFDTCIPLDAVDEKYFSQEVRTTRSFYSLTAFKLLATDVSNGNLDEARKKLLQLDIAALANICIYVCLTKDRRDEILSSGEEKALMNFGFYGKDGKENAAKSIFQILQCKESLARLAVFKAIHELVFYSLQIWPSERYDIHGFIKQLNLIIAMLKCYNNGAIEVSSEINDSRTGDNLKSFDSYLSGFNANSKGDDYCIDPEKILYFANLHRLDQVIKERNKQDKADNAEKVEYKYSRKLSENTPEQYIRQIFYTE